MTEDLSRGYEAAAERFMAARSASGRAVVRGWAASLPPGASVVDVGSGHGEPLTSALVEAGLRVWAIDASPTLCAALRRRLPGVVVACEPAERSAFFDRRFDAALAVGLIFLLPREGQRALIRRLSGVLVPGGRLLFSAPRQIGVWEDVLTGRTCRSLGAAAYGRLLAEAGLRVIGEREDEGGSCYHEAQRVRGPAGSRTRPGGRLAGVEPTHARREAGPRGRRDDAPPRRPSSGG